MKLTSSAFQQGERIPSRYTRDGADVNPPLEISDVPVNAKSLALVMDDPDAPGGSWVHWVLYGMPVLQEIREDSVPGKQGKNDFGRLDYGGPSPPSGTHRYVFTLYALDQAVELREGLSKRELQRAMEGHVVDKAELKGLYSRGGR